MYTVGKSRYISQQNLQEYANISKLWYGYLPSGWISKFNGNLDAHVAELEHAQVCEDSPSFIHNWPLLLVFLNIEIEIIRLHLLSLWEVYSRSVYRAAPQTVARNSTLVRLASCLNLLLEGNVHELNTNETRLVQNTTIYVFWLRVQSCGCRSAAECTSTRTFLFRTLRDDRRNLILLGNVAGSTRRNVGIPRMYSPCLESALNVLSCNSGATLHVLYDRQRSMISKDYRFIFLKYMCCSHNRSMCSQGFDRSKPDNSQKGELARRWLQRVITKAFGETSFFAPCNFDCACIHIYHGHHSYGTTLVKSTLTSFKKPTIVWKLNQPSIIVPAGMSGVADLRLHRPSLLI